MISIVKVYKLKSILVARLYVKQWFVNMFYTTIMIFSTMFSVYKQEWTKWFSCEFLYYLNTYFIVVIHKHTICKNSYFLNVNKPFIFKILSSILIVSVIIIMT